MIAEPFEIDEKTGVITNFLWKDWDKVLDILVPNQIQGVSMLGIGDYTFANTPMLENVAICEGIKRIGKGAFKNCPRLTYVEIPSSVESVEEDAFTYCIRLTRIEIDKQKDSIKEAPWGAANAQIAWKNN